MTGYTDSGDETREGPPDPTRRVVALIGQDGMIAGAHHKQWLLDQTLRILLGAGYAAWREAYDSDPDYEEWDEGIAP